MSSSQRSPGRFLNEKSTPPLVFAAGALLIPAFLLQPDLAVRGLQCLLFLFLGLLAGKRTRLLQHLVVFAGIVAFNLVIPTGRVLWAPLGLPLTEGALKSGLYKATAMSGLIALSQFSIRRDLRFPGRIGGLVGRSLFYFERIMSERKRIDRKNLIASLDALFLETQGQGEESGEIEAQGTPTLGGTLFLALLVLGNWTLLALRLAGSLLLWGA